MLPASRCNQIDTERRVSVHRFYTRARAYKIDTRELLSWYVGEGGHIERIAAQKSPMTG